MLRRGGGGLIFCVCVLVPISVGVGVIAVIIAIFNCCVDVIGVNANVVAIC